MVGKTISHYRVQEKIGEGGMGVVYRAHDEYLDRDVALKVLPTGTLTDRSSQKRLRREAQALSRLNHPNIETLFELSTLDDAEFLAVEYIPGVTLSDMLEKGALPEKDIAHLGAQLAAGLVAAHEQRVLHCDLKPRNLRVTADGRLKILDFGIAKLLKPTIESTASASTPDSSSGRLSAAGTLPYMSPEQVRCEPLDGRSDIYAAGAVLYEMATGERPFREEASSRLIDAILHQPAVPPRARNARISPELERIILKCLEKDPDNRYQTARELEVDLRKLEAPRTTKWAPALERAGLWRPKASSAVILALAIALILLALSVTGWWGRLLSGGNAGRIESLAVLPLENLSKDPEQEYFSDGMTDELITNLGKIKALRVISRTSVMTYKGMKKDLPTIARELNVDAVVEGSVLRSGNRVRISAQLIQAKADRHLWAESYERNLTDVLALQSEVARAIVEQIRISVSPQEEGRLLAAPRVHMDAYDAYLQGRFFWNKRDRESVMTGLKYFEQAIDLDPNYALANTGVADSYLIIGIYSWLAPPEVFPKAKAAALKALEIDDTLAEAHTSMILVKELEWDWKGAEIESRRALDLNPGYATAHQWYSAILTLTGRDDEAIAEGRRAAELDPLSAIIALNGAHSYYYARRFTQARQGIQRTLEISPAYPVQYDLGAIDIEDGRICESVAQLQDTVTRFPENDDLRALLAYAYAISGRQGEARALLNELIRVSKRRYVSPCFVSLVNVGLGKEDEALKWLEDAYRQHDRLLPWFGVDPLFDPLRSDPRFQDLLRRMNLPRKGA